MSGDDDAGKPPSSAPPPAVALVDEGEEPRSAFTLALRAALPLRFRCPFCGGKVSVLEDATDLKPMPGEEDLPERPAVTHTLPTCVMFDRSSAVEYLEAVARKLATLAPN